MYMYIKHKLTDGMSYFTDCPLNIQRSLEVVKDKAFCTVSTTCTNIKCCINVPLLNRTFEVGVSIDYSYEKIMVHIEKMYRKHSFIGFEFGEEHLLSVAGVFKFRYIVVVLYWGFGDTRV